MPGTRASLTAVLLLFLAALPACQKAPNTEGRTAASVNAEEVAPRSTRPSRGEVACHLHSCAPPMYCNRDSGLCEKLECADSRDCPYGYKCNFSRQVCE